jgi:sec-independent protein translocase protein TatA
VDGFGPEKLIFILLVVMLIFGAKRLPEIGSSLGKGIREFKKSVRGDFDEAALPPQGRPQQLPQAPTAQYQAGPAPAPTVQAVQPPVERTEPTQA